MYPVLGGAKQNDDPECDIAGITFGDHWEEDLADVLDVVRKMLTYIPQRRLVHVSDKLCRYYPNVFRSVETWLDYTSLHTYEHQHDQNAVESGNFLM